MDKMEKSLYLTQREHKEVFSQDDPRKLYSRHCEKYGNTLLVAGNRLPANDYILIDRRWFNEIKEKYTQGSLIQELFYSEYTDLGYIDPLTVDS